MAGYTVTNVASDHVENANQDLVNVYDISFTIADKPGSFQVQVEQREQDVVGAAATAIQAVVDQVTGIYAL